MLKTYLAYKRAKAEKAKAFTVLLAIVCAVAALVVLGLAGRADYEAEISQTRGTGDVENSTLCYGRACNIGNVIDSASAPILEN